MSVAMSRKLKKMFQTQATSLSRSFSALSPPKVIPRTNTWQKTNMTSSRREIICLKFAKNSLRLSNFKKLFSNGLKWANLQIANKKQEHQTSWRESGMIRNWLVLVYCNMWILVWTWNRSLCKLISAPSSLWLSTLYELFRLWYSDL